VKSLAATRQIALSSPSRPIAIQQITESTKLDFVNGLLTIAVLQFKP